ncbi:MAG: FeoA family protein [Leptolyngbyaceae cyanobacterium bins.349]|nr:FeoA family protein [Leptolyngbyaceae cyanobacterium bins.349]
MTHQRFTIAGSTLSLLKTGEQGIVTRIASMDETVIHKLRSMGVVPGVTVTVAQRSPQCVIQVGSHQFALSSSTAKAIYLRLHQAPVPANAIEQLNQFAIACLKKFTTGRTHAPQPLCSSGNSR